MRTVRKRSCAACPLRCDVAPAVWAADEYEKLRPYDLPTGQQPVQAFMCHASPEQYCHGWAVVGSRAGHDRELLALRLVSSLTGREVVLPASEVRLFGSFTEAADHGQNEITPDTLRTVGKLVRAHERLR